MKRCAFKTNFYRVIKISTRAYTLFLTYPHLFWGDHKRLRNSLRKEKERKQTLVHEQKNEKRIPTEKKIAKWLKRLLVAACARSHERPCPAIGREPLPAKGSPALKGLTLRTLEPEMKTVN